MITDEEIQKILSKNTFDIGEIQELIESYIQIRTSQSIKVLLPKNMYQLQLFVKAGNHSIDFFLIKFNLTEYLIFHPKN